MFQNLAKYPQKWKNRSRPPKIPPFHCVSEANAWASAHALSMVTWYHQNIVNGYHLISWPLVSRIHFSSEAKRSECVGLSACVKHGHVVPSKNCKWPLFAYVLIGEGTELGAVTSNNVLVFLCCMFMFAYMREWMRGRLSAYFMNSLLVVSAVTSSSGGGEYRMRYPIRRNCLRKLMLTM